MTATTSGTCAITGASGYVGAQLVAHLAQAGWKVRALCRTVPHTQHHGVVHVPFELAVGPVPGVLEGADALVHVAYDFGHTHWSDIVRVNVEGSRRLLTAARDADVRRVVFISTVAAFPGALSMYGRAKLEIERVAIELGAAIVRPGLVWGDSGAAMFGALRNAVERLPLLPLVAPADLELALVYEDDLVLLVRRLLEAWPDGAGELFVATSEQGVTFGQLLHSLSLRAGKHRYFVPVPQAPVHLGLRILETLGVTPPFPSDSLVSLVTADSDPLARATADAGRYDVTFRPYSLA